MTLVDGLVVIAVLGAFGYLVYSKLVQRNHPILQKSKDFFKKKPEVEISMMEDNKWQQPNIERKIY